MNRRETWIAYLLLILGGVFGLHKFYLNRIGWGLAYFFTGGFLLIGCLIDLFTLPGQVRTTNFEMGWPEPPRYPQRRTPTEQAVHQRHRRVAEAEARLDRVLQRLQNVESVMQGRQS